MCHFGWQKAGNDIKTRFFVSVNGNFTDPYQIPPEEWVDDPKKWPPVEFGQIYAYLIVTPGLFTKEKLKFGGLQLLYKDAVHNKWLI